MLVLLVDLCLLDVLLLERGRAAAVERWSFVTEMEKRKPFFAETLRGRRTSADTVLGTAPDNDTAPTHVSPLPPTHITSSASPVPPAPNTTPLVVHGDANPSTRRRLGLKAVWRQRWRLVRR